MRKFVLDASAALKWPIDEPHSDRALLLRGRMLTGAIGPIAPDIFPVEIAHVFSKMCRQRRITAEEAAAYLADVLATPPNLRESLPLIPPAYKLALRFHKSLCDCLYVALAEQEDCPG